MHPDLQAEKHDQLRWDCEQDAIQAHYERHPSECRVVLPPPCYALLIGQAASTGLSVGEVATILIDNGMMLPADIKKAAKND